MVKPLDKFIVLDLLLTELLLWGKLENLDWGQISKKLSPGQLPNQLMNDSRRIWDLRPKKIDWKTRNFDPRNEEEAGQRCFEHFQRCFDEFRRKTASTDEFAQTTSDQKISEEKSTPVVPQNFERTTLLLAEGCFYRRNESKTNEWWNCQNGTKFEEKHPSCQYQLEITDVLGCTPVWWS